MRRADLVALPKAELHIHLELSMDAGLATDLAARPGARPPVGGPWPDQATFVRECEQVRDLIRDLDDLERVAERLVVAADRQGVWWTEVTCAPFNYEGRLGSAEDVLGAVLAGLQRGCDSTRREAGVILAHNRAHHDLRGRELLRLCEEYRFTQGREVGVVALGLVGAEAEHPPHAHRALFDLARARGVRRVPHAGEGAGPEPIRAAWSLLSADRIAHGVRAVESDKLLDDLATAGLCLDVCPTSNVMLRASESLAGHQLRRLLEAGVATSLGSDCTLLLGVDLVTEFENVIHQVGLGSWQVAEIARNSLVHSFARAELVRTALEDLARWTQVHVESPPAVGP